jgi:DNA-binding HxlR family transcriptional regulator
VPRVKKRRSDCPINFALEIFGDKWSLLVIRDLMFMGKTTYGDFLKGPEGIATNILANRLEKLEAADLILKATDPDNGTKFIYSLTERGKDLIPAMLEIISWSGKHDPKTAASKEMLHQITTNRQAVANKVRKKLRSA